VLLNHGRQTATFDVPVSGPARRLRVTPERLPRQPDAPVHETGADDIPLHEWEALVTGKRRIDLDPGELTLISPKESPHE